jgi:hypothetical protein
MSNLRIVHDNASCRATITASSTAGALAAANLQVDDKSSVWRATGTTARLTLTWQAAEEIGAAALICNLSPTATMRVRLSSEQQATNMLTYTELFENAAWSTPAGRSTLTPNALAAPDGTTSAEMVTGNGTGAAYYYQGVTLAAGQTYTASVFLKAGTYSGNVLISDFTESGVAQFNLTTRATAVSGKASNAVMKDMGGGWYRVSATFSPTVAGVHNIGFGSFNASASIYMWGAMFNSGSLSSYYPSGSTPGVRPAGYIDNWQSYDNDSGVVPACPAPAARLRGWTPAQAASAYAYGGGAYARYWFPVSTQALGMAVDIADPDNLQGYIEAVCLVAGAYWSPKYNASQVSLSVIDSTKLYRNDAGGQGAEAGYIYRSLPIDLALMPATDRASFVNIVRNSRAYPILVSVYSGMPDLALERDHLIYGRRARDSAVSIQYALAYSSTINIEEI